MLLLFSRLVVLIPRLSSCRITATPESCCYFSCFLGSFCLSPSQLCHTLEAFLWYLLYLWSALCKALLAATFYISHQDTCFNNKCGLLTVRLFRTPNFLLPGFWNVGSTSYWTVLTIPTREWEVFVVLYHIAFVSFGIYSTLNFSTLKILFITNPVCKSAYHSLLALFEK